MTDSAAAAAPSPSPSAPGAGAGSPPSAPAPGASAPAAPSDSRPSFQSADSFFGDDPAPQPEPTPDTPPADPADPETFLASAPEAIQRHVADLRRTAGQASKAQRESSENYKAAEAHAGIASAAIERLRALGQDVSDLEGGVPRSTQPAASPATPSAPSGFDADAATSAALQWFPPEWHDKMVAGYERLDQLLRAAQQHADAGDPALAAELSGQAKQLRHQILHGQTKSIVSAVIAQFKDAFGGYDTRLGELASRFEAGDAEATNNALAVKALHAAYDAIDDESGSRLWHDRGLFREGKGGRRELTELGQEVWPAMVDLMAERELDPTDTTNLNDTFWAVMGRLGKLKRGSASAAPATTPTGDPTSGLVAVGAPSAAVPQPAAPNGAAMQSQDQIAAQRNRRAFA